MTTIDDLAAWDATDEPIREEAIQEAPAEESRISTPDGSLLGGVLRDLTGGARLSEWQQSVIASLQRHGLHENDPAWLLVLPGLLGMAPVEMVREAIGRDHGAGAFSLADKQVQRISEGIAARIAVEPPEIDAHVIADLVSKRLTPVVRSSIGDMPAIQVQPASAADDCRHHMMEALLNRNMVIAVLAGVLVSAMAWFGGSMYRGSIDAGVIHNLEQQVQVLHSKNK